MTPLSLQWPSGAQPQRVTTPYSADTGTIELYAPAGTPIVAGTAGRVLALSGDSVAIASGQNMVTYGNLRNIRVQIGQQVNAGTVIGESVGPESIRLSVQQAIDPTPLLVREAALYLTPTTDNLRLRAAPVDGAVVSTLFVGDPLESLESRQATQRKLGVRDEWLHVRTADGVEGHAAAWLVEEDKPTPPPAGQITGVNLDLFHPLGHPQPSRLKGVGWVRFLYNVSYNPANNTYGNTDINAVYNRYKPVLEQYARAGVKVLLVLTHQTYGEGRDEYWPWRAMTTDKWRDLSKKYADMLNRIARQYAGQNIVHAYQIWNEQDTPPELAFAAVPVPAADYGRMLAEAVPAIRSADANATIITGGHLTGPPQGAKYARTALAQMPAGVRPDGIAFHAYGRGAPRADKRYAPFGTVGEAVRIYSQVLPGAPVWITEWGVLDLPSDPPEAIAKYATAFVKDLKNNYGDKVGAAIWYAWAQGMHNGYGLVGENDQPRPTLYPQFCAL
jgi:hypothetical protein